MVRGSKTLTESSSQCNTAFYIIFHAVMNSDIEQFEPSVSMDESCSSESEQANSSSDHESGEMGCSYRKKRRVSRYENFVGGSARSV